MPKLLPILTYPAASLKKLSMDVKAFDARLRDLVEDMFHTMYLSGGIGLAAPQIGVNINLFVMDAGQRRTAGAKMESPEEQAEARAHQRGAEEIAAKARRIHMINPKITAREGKILFEEGCLSCPELLVEVERSQSIVVKSLDSEGRAQEHALSEIEAVCTQHEMDHLMGILLTDRISQLKREMYGKQKLRERKDAGDKSKLE
jgi:peptide deformylase